MTTAVQRRRGTNTEHASFTGLEGELSVNTTNESVHVHDGSTAGGFELARADASNIVATSIDINGGTIDGTAIGASSASTGAFTTLTASGLDVTGTATMDGLTVDGAYTDVKFKTTQGRLDLWLTDTDTTEGQVRVRGDANNLVFITDTTERMRINSSGNVGIGTSSPVYSLDVRGEAGIELYNASGGGDVLNLRPSLGDANKYNMSISSYDHSGGGVGPADGISINAFDGVSVATGSSTARQERMRIDSSGNLLVGKTSSSLNTAGVEIDGNTNRIYVTRDSSRPMSLNRLTNDGDMLGFFKDGSTVGSIGAKDGDLYIGTNDTALRFYDASNFIYPVSTVTGTSRDNAIDLGYSNGRFKDIYRSGSTYQSSDRTLKQDIRDLTDSERNVAVACKGLLKAFRFIDAVEKDGDDANIHFGVIAQELAEAFEAEGLDANDYQVYKSSTTTDENGNEQTRLSVCYENLLAFIISAI